MTILAFLSLLWLAGPLHAAGPAPRSLADCHAAALAASETVAQQRELVLQARERVRQAGAAVLPSIAGVAGWQWQDSPGTGTLQKSLGPTFQTTARITGTQPLFRGGREWAVLRQARRHASAQEHSQRQAEVQLFRNVAAAFYAVLSAERDIAILDIQLKAYEERITELADRERIGRSRTSEVLTARAARASLEAQGVQLRGTLSQARESLALLTGLPPDTALSDDAPDVPDPGPLEAWLASVEDRPDVAAARERSEASRAGEWAATGALLPSLDLVGNWYLKRGGVLEDVHWDAQLALTIPIFTGGQALSRIREAKSVSRQAGQALSLARRTANTDIRALWERLRADRGQVEALARAVELAQASYDQQAEEYRQGLVNNLEVLTALNTLQDMRRALDRARYLVHADHASLLAAAGRAPGVPASAGTPGTAPAAQ